MPWATLRQTVQLLCRAELLVAQGPQRWRLTPAGYAQGRRVLRRHLLWEHYLVRHVDIQPDHVHDDAESTEHLIDADLEQRLMELLPSDAADSPDWA